MLLKVTFLLIAIISLALGVFVGFALRSQLAQEDIATAREAGMYFARIETSMLYRESFLQSLQANRLNPDAHHFLSAYTSAYTTDMAFRIKRNGDRLLSIDKHYKSYVDKVMAKLQGHDATPPDQSLSNATLVNHAEPLVAIMESPIADGIARLETKLNSTNDVLTLLSSRIFQRFDAEEYESGSCLHLGVSDNPMKPMPLTRRADSSNTYDFSTDPTNMTQGFYVTVYPRTQHNDKLIAIHAERGDNSDNPSAVPFTKDQYLQIRLAQKFRITDKVSIRGHSGHVTPNEIIYRSWHQSDTANYFITLQFPGRTFDEFLHNAAASDTEYTISLPTH